MSEVVRGEDTTPLVHGMGKKLAEPDWKPIAPDEAAALLSHYPRALSERGIDPDTAKVLWYSPRPMFAAALVGHSKAALFVKRHDVHVRQEVDLLAEHAFIAHLRVHGQPIPEVLRSDSGSTVFVSGNSLYEVHAPLDGLDLYRDAPSWSPFMTVAHAHSAGATLAQFHRDAREFPLPRRPVGVLQNSMILSAATDPRGALDALFDERPALASELLKRPFAADLKAHLASPLQECAAVLSSVSSQWTHGDWHPSNLSWSAASTDATVCEIFDFGLSNRTAAVHDLAVAIERSTIDWLDLGEHDSTSVDVAAIDALVNGYQEIRPLDEVERTALPLILPVAHIEYALSEIEYFSDVVHQAHNTDLAYAYLVGHATWFESVKGRAIVDHLRAIL